MKDGETGRATCEALAKGRRQASRTDENVRAEARAALQMPSTRQGEMVRCCDRLSARRRPIEPLRALARGRGEGPGRLSGRYRMAETLGSVAQR